MDTKNLYRDIDFQVDTVTVDRHYAPGYFSEDSRTITIEHIKNAQEMNEWANKDGTFVHEQKHRDKVHDLKHRLTYVPDDEFDDENYVGLWGKIKYKAAQIKENLTTETEVDANGEEWEGKCSVWKGLQNKVSNWFKSSPQQAPVKNEPTHPVDAQKPQYREWKNEDGSRVSAVQHRQILDMNKEIIQKPAKTNIKPDSSGLKNKMKADVANARNKQSRSTVHASKQETKQSPTKQANRLPLNRGRGYE